VVKEPSGPQRTCLGCGKRDNQNGLIRLTLTEQGALIVDQMRGRGAYLHRTKVCWRAFLGRKGQYRAFRAEIDRAEKERLIETLMNRDRE
jgi:predicted RNA-binding protein YlxR (DUF448 family)